LPDTAQRFAEIVVDYFALPGWRATFESRLVAYFLNTTCFNSRDDFRHGGARAFGLSKERAIKEYRWISRVLARNALSDFINSAAGFEEALGPRTVRP
jgi:hypothetical protein